MRASNNDEYRFRFVFVFGATINFANEKHRIFIQYDDVSGNLSDEKTCGKKS